MVPPWVEAFCWLVIASRVSTADMLRRGITSDGISDNCVMCRSMEETTNHLFIHCEITSSIWSHLFY